MQQQHARGCYWHVIHDMACLHMLHFTHLHVYTHTLRTKDVWPWPWLPFDSAGWGRRGFCAAALSSCSAPQYSSHSLQGSRCRCKCEAG